MYHGLPPIKAFKIMEFVRKGKASKDPDTWKDHKETMQKYGIEEWFIDSCEKIKYMFPKAHAAAYVTMGWRVGYYKVYYPLAYYAAYFSIRAADFNYEKMCQGLDHLREEMALIKGRIDQGTDTPKDNDLLKYMYNVEEMYARGFDFMPIDIYKAGASKFRIFDGKLMPSFQAIDGMGEKAAVALEEEAAKGKFTSREELKSRTKLSGTMTDKLYSLGLLGNMPESSQLSIMDFLK